MRNRCARILNKKSTVENPLASLALFILYHAVTIIIVARSEREARAGSELLIKLNILSDPYGG